MHKRNSFFIIFLFINLIAAAQSNKVAKAAPNFIGSAGNQATVASVTYAWSVGETIVFTGIDPTGFLTQGFHQPMICKAIPTVVALNQNSCSLPYSLTASLGFDKYLWKLGKATIANASGNVYNPVVNGNYTVTVMDSTGCSLTTNPISVDLSSKNIIPIITRYGPSASRDTLLECSDAFSYQWYVITPTDGVHRAIVGQTNKYFVPIFNGTYYVKINTLEYCVAYSSYYTVNNSSFSPISKEDFESTDSTIVFVSRRNAIASRLNVYPIPSRDKLNIEYQTSNDNTVVFSFYDLKGILIESRLMKSQNGSMNWVYENDNLPTGKYLLRVVDGENRYDKNVIFE